MNELFLQERVTNKLKLKKEESELSSFVLKFKSGAFALGGVFFPHTKKTKSL